MGATNVAHRWPTAVKVEGIHTYVQPFGYEDVDGKNGIHIKDT